jgi:hypothetical protein
MSEPNGMSCDDFAEVAAEFSLGVLTGRERAQAIAHLDDCENCREHVRQLSLTGEELLGLLPTREPPEGFESRVMGRLGVAAKPKRPNWSRRMLTMAAVALAVVACGIGGWGLRGAMGPASGGSTAQEPLREATLLTAAHQSAGKIYLYDGNPRWLYMGVDTHASSNDSVVCQLVERDGHVITIGSFPLNGGYGAWGSPDPVAASNVAGARITTMDGTVLASASFKTSS